MTAIDRTVYPQPGRWLGQREIAHRYALSDDERAFVAAKARGDANRIVLAVLLKARSHFGFFVESSALGPAVIARVADQLGLVADPAAIDAASGGRSHHRFVEAVRRRLDAHPWGEAGRRVVADAVADAAQRMSDPADLINRAIEALREARIDLPAFSTLDRQVNAARFAAQDRIFQTVADRLDARQSARLDGLLKTEGAPGRSGLVRLAEAPGPAGAETLSTWIERLEWLDGLLDDVDVLAGVADSLRRQFAAEASAMEVGDFARVRRAGRRYTLLFALAWRARMRCRDELAEMLLRLVRRMEVRAREALDAALAANQASEEQLLEVFGLVLEVAATAGSEVEVGRGVLGVLASSGGTDALAAQLGKVSVVHGDDTRPFMPAIHRRQRALLLRLLGLFEFGATLPDRGLLAAARAIGETPSCPPEVLGRLDLAFADKPWRALIERSGEDDRRRRDTLEACVLVHLAVALQSGAIYIENADEFGDWRRQLLSEEECRRRISAYCAAIGLPETPDAIVAALRDELIAVAAEFDATFPANAALRLDDSGRPRLHRPPCRQAPPGLAAFEDALRREMPERRLLDILVRVENWTGFTKRFGPPSGFDPKLDDAVRRYLFTVFAYGCNLGPVQAARHAPDIASAQVLRRLNAQHFSGDKLDAATADIANVYNQLELPRLWGTGEAAIADGSHMELRENNLAGARHIRYGGYGGIAYRHIADTYIAIFTTFIPCGVWEAVHLFDGLLQSRAEIRPTVIHGDTQSQSEPVFGLGRLLGLELQPRIRGLSRMRYHRPDKAIRYRNVDRLFGPAIDWRLIAANMPEMLRVAISIQAGSVTPSRLLRRLGSYSRSNPFYRALRELGRAVRTKFLLRYLSSSALRSEIQAQTVKIESYNAFSDWIQFGGPIIKSDDPVEHDKKVKYTTLIANAIMLSNAVDMTNALSNLSRNGHDTGDELIERTSPYLSAHIRRFGEYTVDVEAPPEPLDRVRLLLGRDLA